MTTLPGEPRSYAEVAAELHRIANVLADLPGCPSYVSLGIQPGPRNGDNDSVTASVDAVARAVLGKPGKTERMSGGTWQRAADSWLGVMAVRIYDKVSGPPDERDAEIERLRSELAEARVRAMPVPNVDKTPTRHMRAGFGYSREADEPEPGAVPGGVDGHSEFSGRASVPDMKTRCAAVLGDGSMCDVPIWWNASANAWWHLSDGRFNHTATGPSVPPSDGCE